MRRRLAVAGAVLTALSTATIAFAEVPLNGTYVQTSVKNPAEESSFFVDKDKVRVRIENGEVKKFYFRFSGRCNQIGPTGGNVYTVFTDANDEPVLRGDKIVFKERRRDPTFGKVKSVFRGEFDGGVLKGTFRDRSYKRSVNLKCRTTKIKWTAKLP